MLLLTHIEQGRIKATHTYRSKAAAETGLRRQRALLHLIANCSKCRNEGTSPQETTTGFVAGNQATAFTTSSSCLHNQLTPRPRYGQPLATKKDSQ